MFKQSPSRNQRSKGFKIKHALQIGLLLAVCIWLIYQVKHSHDKKKAFEESTAKLSERIESRHDIIKFGRKDLNPRVEETASENERHGEQEETQEEEGESKHEEEEEQEEEENKPEESENEGRGGGDDEIDEHEQERTEEEAKREEDFVDEEEREKQDNENEEKEMEEKQSDESEEKENEEETKESEEKENEEETKENEEETKEREDQIEEQDHDRNTQEAREEQYKGDDASSAVVRDTQAVSTEAESGVIGNSNEKEHVENLQANELGMENKTNNLDEVTSEQNDSDLKAGDGQTTEVNSTVNATDGNSVLNATEIEERGTEISLSKLEDGSLPILTTTKESIDLQEVNNSSIAENVGTPGASLQNGTDITQDPTVETTTSNGEGDLDHQPVLLDQTEKSSMTAEMLRSDSISSLSTTTENEDASKKDSEESSSNSGTVLQEEQNGREEGSSESSTTTENGDGYQNEKSETTTETEDNSSSSTTNDNVDSIDINSTEDSLIPEVKEARTDLGTLPKIETEGNNSEDDVAAER